MARAGGEGGGEGGGGEGWSQKREAAAEERVAARMATGREGEMARGREADAEGARERSGTNYYMYSTVLRVGSAVCITYVSRH